MDYKKWFDEQSVCYIREPVGGLNGLDLEDLYQAMKARLIDELSLQNKQDEV